MRALLYFSICNILIGSAFYLWLYIMKDESNE